MVEESPFDKEEVLVEDNSNKVSFELPMIDLTKYGLVAVKNIGDVIVAWKIVPVEMLVEEAEQFSDKTLKRNQ